MALGEFAIITLADLKSHLGITGSTYDAQLEDAIDAASGMVEDYLGRKVISRRFREWTTAKGRGTYATRERPISIVHAIRFGRLASMVIDSTEATDIAALVSVNSDHIRLDRIDSSGTEHQTTLSFGANKTTTDMASAITATTGFTATVSVNTSIYYIHRVAGRDLKQSTLTLYSVDQAQLDTEVDYERGIIHMKSSPWGWGHAGFPMEPLSLLVDYTAGWDIADVPFQIQQATRAMAAGLYFGRQRDPSLASESLGDYSYTLANLEDDDRAVFRALQAWRKLR